MILDPFLFPEQFGRIKLSGRLLPGIIVSIQGAERGYDWKVQKAQGSSGASSVYGGQQLAESIKIVLAGTSIGDFAALADLRIYIAPAKGGKPPGFNVENPYINFNDINRVSIKKIGQPEPAKGKYTTIELEFIEFNPPSPAKTGTADPVKPGDPPKPADAAEKTMQDLLKKIAAV